MVTRFVTNDDLWREIQTRVDSGKRIRAAVAYFGGHGATLLKLKRGDSIVVDMSIAAVRQGVTNPREIQTLFQRGVNVFSRGSLHAKFLIIDKTLIASSANASNNSKKVLDEAGILTTEPAALRRAIDYFDKLCTEPVGKEYLRKCIAEYRRPIFKAAAERATPSAKRSRRVVEAKLWFIGGLVALNLSDDAKKSIESLERRTAKNLKQPERTEVDWIRFGGKRKFLQHIRVGDSVVACTKDGNGRYVGPPSRVLSLDEWRSPRGKRYTMLMLESPIDGERISLSQFRKQIASIQPELNHRNPRTKPIKDSDRADDILRFWTANRNVATAKRK